MGALERDGEIGRTENVAACQLYTVPYRCEREYTVAAEGTQLCRDVRLRRSMLTTVGNLGV